MTAPGFLRRPLLSVVMVFLGPFAALSSSHAEDLAGCIARKVPFDGSVLLRYATVSRDSGPRDYLYRSYPSRCGATPRLSCRSQVYIVPGDDVWVGKTCGSWSYVQYIGKRRITTAWAFSSTLKALPLPTIADAIGPNLLSFQGLGEIRIGMAVSKLKGPWLAIENGAPAGSDISTAQCVDVNFYEEFANLGLQTQGGVVQRVDVISNSHAETIKEIHLGSTEAEVKQAYAGQFLEGASSQYDVNSQAGLPRGPKTRSRSFLIKSKDGKRALLIETDGAQVVSMHAGVISDFQRDGEGSLWVIPCEVITG
jgi:hypothetical protein